MISEKDLIRKPSGRDIDRLTLHEQDGVVWLSFPLLDQYDFVLGAFSTRIGGVSEGDASSMNLSLSRELTGGRGRKGLVTDRPEGDAWAREGEEAWTPEGESARKRFEENHRRYACAVGYDAANLVFSDQTHTDTIVEVTGQDRGNGMTRPNAFHDVDGLMTRERQVALMTFYADCVPLLLLDPVRRAIACVHSGWRGTIAGIGTKAALLMKEKYGSRPEDLVAAIGPSICQDCYEVSDPVADRFRDRYGYLGQDLDKIVRPGREGHAYLGLQEACRQNFLQAGLTWDHISLPDLCTMENSGLLFSHRASGGKRGNLAAVLMLKEG